jgi:hypothetical protein
MHRDGAVQAQGQAGLVSLLPPGGQRGDPGQAGGAAGLVVAGFVFFFMAPFSSLFTGLLGGLMCALGFFSAGIALGSLTLLLSMGLINLLIRYGRFHVRLIKPVTA